jgi:hypothetical protein
VDENEECPPGCVAYDEHNEISELSLLLERKRNEFLNPGGIHPFPQSLRFPHSTSHKNSSSFTLSQSTHMCVLDACAEYSLNACLNHTEYMCVPGAEEEGCRYGRGRKKGKRKKGK